MEIEIMIEKKSAFVVSNFNRFYMDTKDKILSDSLENAQCAERILSKIAKPLNDTFTGLKCIMRQGFRICFV